MTHDDDRTIPVAVIGAGGRMGSEARRAIEAATDLELVARLGREDSLQAVVDAGAAVAVDLTVPSATRDNVRFLVDHGIHAVVGTTGWDEESLDAVRTRLADAEGGGVLIAPNFAIGAVLAMRFAEIAARYYDSAEIIEMHHPDKLDAPPRPATPTAAHIAGRREAGGLGPVPDATEKDPLGARGALVDGIHVHAVERKSVVAHEEIGRAHV